MTLQQDMARLRKELSKEQDKFEDSNLNDSEVIEINEKCGVLRRKIRRMEYSSYA